MAASFCRPANFQSLIQGNPVAFLETLRLGAEVYYGQLIQLHLPYIMRIGDNAKHKHSKISCANVSREILTHFTAHRTFNPVSSCSRPVDFFALLSAMTLILAHLGGQDHQEVTNFLAHQRLSYRAVLDQVLEKMDVISTFTRDVVTESSADLIRRLLGREANPAEGSNCTVRSMIGEEGVQEGNEESEELR